MCGTTGKMVSVYGGTPPLHEMSSSAHCCTWSGKVAFMAADTRGTQSVGMRKQAMRINDGRGEEVPSRRKRGVPEYNVGLRERRSRRDDTHLGSLGSICAFRAR